MFPHVHVEEYHHDGINHHHYDSSENELSIFFSHYGYTSEVFSTNHLENVVKVVNEVSNAILVVNKNRLP